MNILVVEDDRDIREMVCQSLAQSDFHTIGCPDVKEAKQSIKKHHPDCLVTLLAYIDWLYHCLLKLEKWIREGTRASEVYDDPGLAANI